MFTSYSMDLEVSMGLEDETTSCEVTGNLMVEVVDTELVSELPERVLCCDEDLPRTLEKRIESLLDHICHEVSRFLIMPMSYIWGRRTRKIGHIGRLCIK